MFDVISDFIEHTTKTQPLMFDLDVKLHWPAAHMTQTNVTTIIISIAKTLLLLFIFL